MKPRPRSSTPTETGKPVRMGVIDLPSFYADFELTGRKPGSEPKKHDARCQALCKSSPANMDGIILDLRRKRRFVEKAINLTGLFIKEGPVVQVKDHNEQVCVDKDTDSSVQYDGPLIVLTSRFSASASKSWRERCRTIWPRTRR